MAAETPYREKRLSVFFIAGKRHISKSTLYGYLRHRRVDIGPYNKPAQARTQKAKTAVDQIQNATILLSLRVENNSKFVRGKKRVREDIERYIRHQYAAIQGQSGEYRLKVPYRSDEELDKTVQDFPAHRSRGRSPELLLRIRCHNGRLRPQKLVNSNLKSVHFSIAPQTPRSTK